MKKRNLRLKRLIISIALLLCGVFALYPYLAARPMRNLRKSVAGLEKPLAASVLTTLSLGENLAVKARQLAAKGEHKARLTDLADTFEKDAKALKKALLAMPEKSSSLSGEASALYSALDERVSRFVTQMAEGEK